MSVNLTEAKAHLQGWLSADLAVAKNQSYTINNRTWTRADAQEITNKIEYWSNKVSTLSGKSKRGIGRVFY